LQIFSESLFLTKKKNPPVFIFDHVGNHFVAIWFEAKGEKSLLNSPWN
jgi:hypothetical protein